jgi:putative protease
MKLLTNFYNLESLDEILKYADGVIIGLSGFSTRETSYLKLEELEEVSKKIKSEKKELYLSLKPFIGSQKDGLLTLFDLIKDFYITGLIVGDIGYYSLLKDYNFKIVYNPETTLTNSYDINILKDYGIKGAFISKEITLTDIKEIIKLKELPLYMTVHGYLNMFYSKRQLLKSYFEYLDITHDYNHDKMRLKEEKRDSFNPIVEDTFGTHIYRSEVTSYIDYLDELKELDYFVVDGIFHTDEYIIDILKLFRNPSKDLKEALESKYKEKWDTGFFFKKTIYK